MDDYPAYELPVVLVEDDPIPPLQYMVPDKPYKWVIVGALLLGALMLGDKNER